MLVVLFSCGGVSKLIFSLADGPLWLAHHQENHSNMDNHKIEDYVAISFGLPIELQGENFEQRIRDEVWPYYEELEEQLGEHSGNVTGNSWELGGDLSELQNPKKL